MYVLKHGRRWWNDVVKLKCPDCGTKIQEGSNFFIEILEQEHRFWKQSCSNNYDMQYLGKFKCLHCTCIFMAWSHIIENAGPVIGSQLIGSDAIIRNWNGFVADKKRGIQ